jgi:type IV pilus assembly protein PilQ
MLTPEIGKVSADERARHLIVTDVPVVVEQVRELVTQLDIPVKQVVIDAMVVDVALNDAADTGVDWLIKAITHQNLRQAALGADGRSIGTLQDLSYAAKLPLSNPASTLTFGLLTNDIDWHATIQAEVRNRNGRLVSNPVLVSVENEIARITIAEEIPYTELTQTQQGGNLTSTQFKEVGTVLEVTPQVTHDNHIILKMSAKESGTLGEFNGVPIENKREIETSLRINDGQTVFVGGLRKNDNQSSVKKVPILGNIPVVNFMFRQNSRTETADELLVFLNCKVMDEELPQLSPFQANAYKDSSKTETKVDAEKGVIYDTLHPKEAMDPIEKWRRSE